MVASVDGRLVTFGTRCGPFDGTAQLHGTERRDHLVGINRNLAAEPSAHLGGDEIKGLLDPTAYTGRCAEVAEEQAVRAEALARTIHEDAKRGRGDAGSLRSHGPRSEEA